MGTWMAPYTNLFMEYLENHLLNSLDKWSLVWWRYIDDVFAIWIFGEGCLARFVDQLNGFHPTIKFTTKWSQESMSFLDVRIHLREGQITTDLYTKPTDTH